MEIPDIVKEAMQRLTPEQVVAYLRERASQRMNALDGKVSPLCRDFNGNPMPPRQINDSIRRAYAEDCAALLLAAEAMKRNKLAIEVASGFAAECTTGEEIEQQNYKFIVMMLEPLQPKGGQQG